MSAPAVSVLVPARDAAATIREAVQDVLAQTFTDFELVVVDDGSRDETASILESFAAADVRVRVLRTAPRGIVAALNDGLQACRGELVARFDADDRMAPTRLARQVEALADPAIDAVGSLVRCFPDDAVRPGMRTYEAWQNALATPAQIRANRFVECPLVHPSVTLRRSVLRGLGGWRDVPWAEDWDLFLRFFEAGHAARKVPELLHFWREGEARLTRRDPRYGVDAMRRIRAHFLARGPLRDRPAIVWGAGPIGKRLVRALEQEGATVDAFIDIAPRKIGGTARGRPVLGPEALERPGRAVLLGAVGAPGARAEIRAEAGARGWTEGVDFFCCA